MLPLPAKDAEKLAEAKFPTFFLIVELTVEPVIYNTSDDVPEDPAEPELPDVPELPDIPALPLEPDEPDVPELPLQTAPGPTIVTIPDVTVGVDIEQTSTACPEATETLFVPPTEQPSYCTLPPPKPPVNLQV